MILDVLSVLSVLSVLFVLSVLSVLYLWSGINVLGSPDMFLSVQIWSVVARNDKKPFFHTQNTNSIMFLDVLSVLSLLSVLSVLLMLPDMFCGLLIWRFVWIHQDPATLISSSGVIIGNPASWPINHNPDDETTSWSRRGRGKGLATRLTRLAFTMLV
jgi:hypothetical protein